MTMKRNAVPLTPALRIAAGVLLLTSLVLDPRSASARQSDEILRSIQELRNGGPVYPADSRRVPFNGVRWVTDTLEYTNAAARRALEYVTGVDITGAGRENIVPSSEDEWRKSKIPESDIRLQQYIGPATFYSWNGTLDSAPSDITQPSSDNKTFWQRFLQDQAPLPKNRHGFGALATLQLLARQQEVETGLTRIAPPGGTLPELYDERLYGTAGAIVGGPAVAGVLTSLPNLNRIYRPHEFTQQNLRDLQSTPYELAYNAPYPHNPASLSSPDEQLVSVHAGPEPQRRVESVAFGTQGDENSAAGSGQANVLLGVVPQGNAFAQSVVQQAILNQALAQATAAIQSRLNAVGSVQNFLGPAASGVSNLLGPDRFNDLASNLFGGPGGTPSFPGFPSGGGPQRLADIPSRPPTTDSGGACATPGQNVSAEAAKGTAALLGIPPAPDSNNPWEVQYVSARKAYGVIGREPFTNEGITIDQSVFPNPDTCVWVVSSVPPDGPRQAAFIEDAPTENGVEFRLVI